jgi:hypothetical protein
MKTVYHVEWRGIDGRTVYMEFNSIERAIEYMKRINKKNARLVEYRKAPSPK